MTRLFIIHPFVQQYRHSLYGRLTSTLREHGIETLVVQNQPPPALAARQDTATAAWATPAPTRWLRLRGRDVAIRDLRSLRMGSGDLVIVEQAIKNVETYPQLARQHFGGPSVAMWGHGRSYSTPQGPSAAALKQFLTRRSQWFFAYTQAGADHVIAHGFPATRVSVLNNTIDTDALQADLARISDEDVAAFQRRHGLAPGRTALFLGGVDRAKGIDFLVESATHAAAQLPGFVLLVGGAGADLPKVRAAQSSGAPVRALGRLDGEDRALALRAADVLALPQSIGLVAVDSLVAGRPIITRDNDTHGPEADYLRGDLAVWLPGSSDAAAYGSAVAHTLERPGDLSAMQVRCLTEAPRYSLDHMVDSFVEGVLAWDDVRRAGL